MKKLSKKKIREINEGIEVEGGLIDSINHGFIFKLAKGTELAPLLDELDKLVRKIENLLEDDEE